MRASQINHCAYCLDMHSKELRRDGESEQRIYLLNGWRESPLYTPRERAAPAWTEAVIRIAETQAPGQVYEEVLRAFQRQGIGRSDHSDRNDQPVEPPGDQSALRASDGRLGVSERAPRHAESRRPQTHSRIADRIT